MVIIRIETIHHKGPAYGIDPNLDPSELSKQSWGDFAQLQDVSFSGPAVLVNPLLRPYHIANLARALGPSAMSEVFYLQTPDRIIPSAVLPLESGSKSDGTELVDRVSFDVLGRTPPHNQRQ